MTDEKKYKIEMKRSGILPRCLKPWGHKEENLSLDEILIRVRERQGKSILKVRQDDNSTVVNCKISPSWNCEGWDRWKKHCIQQKYENPLATLFQDPNDYVSYRVTPSIKITFSERSR